MKNYYPKFYIRGLAAHVGQCFEGFDATTVACLLTQSVAGGALWKTEPECPAPRILELRDLKPEYNVQTATDAFVRLRLSTSLTGAQVAKWMKLAALESLEGMKLLLNERYREYCALCGMNYRPIRIPVSVLTPESLREKAEPPAEADSLSLIREWVRLTGITTPVAVAFLDSETEEGGELHV